jgi:hypothetical protein
MNNEPPVLPHAGRSPSRVLVWTALVAVAVVLLCAGGIVLLRLRHHTLQPPPGPAEGAAPQTEKISLTEREPELVPDLPPPRPDFSTSNTVSVLLGQKGSQDGLRHLAKEPDGRTTIENLEGVPCRHHNRKPDNKQFGYVYFVIDPTFKREELKAARIEVEYLLPAPCFLRLQYDAMEGEAHRSYKSVVATSGETVSWGAGIQYMHIQATNAWRTATFHIKDGAFLNSQNGGADFRLEFTPAEIYVRRVSVTREKE